MPQIISSNYYIYMHEEYTSPSPGPDLDPDPDPELISSTGKRQVTSGTYSQTRTCTSRSTGSPQTPIPRAA